VGSWLSTRRKEKHKAAMTKLITDKIHDLELVKAEEEKKSPSTRRSKKQKKDVEVKIVVEKTVKKESDEDVIAAVQSSEEEVMVDSGAVDMVCLKKFAEQIPMREAKERRLRSATGQRIQHYGNKRMRFLTKTQNDRKVGLQIDMNVMDVKRGIFSVPVMCDQNLNVLFRKDGGKIWRDGDHENVIPMVRKNKLFVLKGKTEAVVAPVEEDEEQLETEEEEEDPDGEADREFEDLINGGEAPAPPVEVGEGPVPDEMEEESGSAPARVPGYQWHPRSRRRPRCESTTQVTPLTQVGVRTA